MESAVEIAAVLIIDGGKGVAFSFLLLSLHQVRQCVFPLDRDNKPQDLEHCLWYSLKHQLAPLFSQITLPLSQRFKLILLCVVEQTTGIIGTPAEIAAWNAPV